MTNRLPLTDRDGEVRELSAEEFKRGKSFSQLPATMQAKLRALRGRGPQRSPTKIQTAVRYDSEVLQHLKKQGPGWQTRMNEALKKAIEEGIA